jgi:hypothetical protein
MTTPTVDTTHIVGPSGAGFTVAVTTTTANLLAIVVSAVSIGSGSNPVANVTASGLTFTRIAAVWRPGAGSSMGLFFDDLNVEVWAAPLIGPLTALPVTVTMSFTSGMDSAACLAIGINDCDRLNPFDFGAGTLPAEIITGAGPPTVSSYQTTVSADLLMYILFIENTLDGGGPPTSFTTLFHTGVFSGVRQSGLEVATYAPGMILPGSILVSPTAGGQCSVMLLLAFSGPLVTTTVPNVIGDTLSVAAAAITAAGLHVSTTTLASSLSVPAGEVLSQLPAAGAHAYDGDPVALVLSNGPPACWTLSPDWQTPVRERLGFLTDVLPTWTGTEQRRALRIAPRRVFQFATLASQAEKRYIENTLFAWSALEWELPIFPDGQRLAAPIAIGDTLIACDTVNRDFIANGFAVVIQDALNFEIFQLSTLTSTQLNLGIVAAAAWPVGSRLYPLRRARLLSYPKLSHNSQETFSVSIDFTVDEPCDWPAASGLPTYRTLPVLEDSPDVSAPPAGDHTREANIIDSVTGAIDVDDTAMIGFPGMVHDWYLKGRTARAAFRSLLYLLKGRLGMMWIPTYNADLLLLSPLTSIATTMTVQAAGLPTLAVVQNRRDIRIELLSGAVYYRRITAAAAGAPGQEVASLDSALGVAVAVAQVRRISFMTVSRLDADEIEIQHFTMSDGLASSQTRFRAINYET